MANIIPLKDNTGAQFYPQTHEKAVVDSNGVNLQTKLASITTPTYVTAWDGDSTPVVANIPAGVTVTYNTTSYTGTLAASASTANKTYLVSTGTTDNYYRYVTELSGSTYSWHNIGTTAIQLSDYATKAELSQLDQNIVDFSQETLEYGIINLLDPTQWANRSSPGHYMLDVQPGEQYILQASADYAGYFAVLKERPTYDYGTHNAPSTAPVYSTAEGFTTQITITKNTKRTIIVPADGVCLYIKQSANNMLASATRYGSKSYAPQIEALTSGLKTLGDKTDVVFRSVGYLHIINALKVIEVHEAFRVDVQGVAYTIPMGTSVDISNITTIASTQAKIVFDTDNLTLKVAATTLSRQYPMVAIVSKNLSGPHNITNVETSPVLNIIKIDDNWVVPRNEEKFPYVGERLQVPGFSLDTYVKVADLPTHQSGVFYGNYGIFFSSEDDEKVYIVDLPTRSLLATLDRPSTGTYYAPHCNVACLGLVKGDDDKSICPLIYVSQWTQGHERACFVYDVQLDDDVFSIEQVQVINLASISSSIIGSGPCDFVVDSDNERLVAYAYQTAQSADEGTALMIAEFALPSLTDAEVILTDADVLHNCSGVNIPRRQDAFYLNGKIVFGSGRGTSELPGFMNADRIDTGRTVTKIPLHKLGAWGSKEPEALGTLGNKILLTAGTVNIYKLDS